MSASDFGRDPFAFHGRVEMRPFASRALRGNALGDPHEREVPVYLPPGHDHGDRYFPVVFLLSGFTGRGHKLLETHPWHEGPVLRFDREVQAGRTQPLILVMPDAFTRLGGSQYVDSPAVGDYETYVGEELVDFVDAHYPTLGDRRGVAGKSSGGFGALHLAMRRPGTFHAVASIAGDCHFEFGYAQSFLGALRALGQWGGDPRRFLLEFAREPKLTQDAHAVLELLAMSACYSPNPDSELGFDLPVDLETGERRPLVWKRWLEFDPVVACEPHAAGLRALEWLHLECGLADEFHLQFSTRILVRKLRSLGIACEHEEFEGGHFDTGGRWDAVLKRMGEVL
jgi:enterochelin esterase family protein